MDISEQWLKESSACKQVRIWWRNQKETDGLKVVQALIKDKKLSWANWTIVRIMSYEQYVAYGVYAAEQVIKIYEKKYPDDKRPRQAIEAAKKCIDNPSQENKAAADAAADAAYAAAYDAADAAYAANAANAAAYAADAAAYDANVAAYDAYADAYDAYAANAMKLKILKYGIKLLRSVYD